ncbi:hypothetical protein [Candidatus Phytoplasma prunorum]|uniref:hypothetical protein n=1 Tax=Candidatus Phytoplasma prunorum TaxID=47565 RepID=UPI002FF050B7
MYKNIENKKNFIFRFILVIISFIVFLLNIIIEFFVTGKIFENILSLTQCSYLFVFLILILSFINSKSKFISKLQYKKIASELNFIALVNILLSVVILVDVTKNIGLISPNSTNNLGVFIYFFNYILGYFIFPILFLYFFCYNYDFPNYKNLWILLIFPFFYFLIDFSIYFFKDFFTNEMYFLKNNFLYNLFISPYIKKNSISLILNLFKIMLSFLFLGGSLIFINNLKIYKLFKLFLIILLFFCISLIFYNKYDLQHMRKALMEHSTQGSLLSVEAQHFANEISNNITNKTKDELNFSNKKILELGAGIGNITQYLVDKYGEENIISIEINSDSCKFLSKRFPGLKVIEGNVKDIKTLLTKNGFQFENIEGIISSLPVTILPDDVVKELDFSIEEIMKANKGKIKYKEYQLFPFFDIIHKNKLHLIEHNKQNFKLEKKYYLFTNYFIPVVIFEYIFNNEKVDEKITLPSYDNYSLVDDDDIDLTNFVDNYSINNHTDSPFQSSVSMYSLKEEDIFENSKDNNFENLSNIINSNKSLSICPIKKIKNKNNFFNKFKKWINKIF